MIKWGNLREGILLKTEGTYVPKVVVGGHGVKQFLDEKGLDQWIENEIGFFRQGLDFVEYMKSCLPHNDDGLHAS